MRCFCALTHVLNFYASQSKCSVQRDSQRLNIVSSQQIQVSDLGDNVENLALFTSLCILGYAHKSSQLAGRSCLLAN